jgi:hypothetical protein
VVEQAGLIFTMVGTFNREVREEGLITAGIHVGSEAGRDLHDGGTFNREAREEELITEFRS